MIKLTRFYIAIMLFVLSVFLVNWAAQAALHGLLKKVRDLGMPLLSVNRVETGPAQASEVKPSSPIQ